MGYLDVRNLSVSYGGKTILNNCSFTVNRGEILVVLGTSGVGKTTLLKTIAGLVSSAKGTIEFEKEKVIGPDEQLVPGHPFIKLINQDFSLDEFHTVEENLRLRLLSFDKNYQSNRVSKLLRLTKLTAYKGKKAKELSGGQRQRLAIARALADEPQLVLMDEPFNQLDFQTKQKVAQHIKRYLKDNAIGAIMVTHNGQEALEWGDRIAHIDKGKIVRIDTAENFYLSPSSLSEARFFGPINMIKLNDKSFFFRPTDFRVQPNEIFNLSLSIVFKEKQFRGWYTAYFFFFCTENGLVNKKIQFVLYSQTDLSRLTEIFIKKTAIFD